MGEHHSLMNELVVYSLAIGAWYRGLLEGALWPSTAVFNLLGFCQGYPTLSSWPKDLPCEHRGLYSEFSFS